MTKTLGSTTADTKEIVERMYGAAMNGNVATLTEVFSPDLVLEQPPSIPFGGVYRGLAEFWSMATKAAEILDFTQMKIESLTAEGQSAFGVVRLALLSGAEVVATEEWTVKDGQIVHGRVSWFDTTPFLASEGP